MVEAVGLSVGATNMAAVVRGRTSVTRQSVVTLFRHRPPEVGVPSENPNLNERGLVIAGFVDRVGDPVGIVAADRSTHRSEALVADALRALLHTVTDPRPPPVPAVVTYPAHWRPAAAEALRRGLSAVPELSRDASAPMSDALAALTALQAEPGVPARGVIALCDFGGTGSNITLADAADDFRPIGPTLRHTEFSGDLIDQALLKHIMADLSSAGSVDVSGTSAIGALNRLRTQCRGAKERLSGAAVTTVPVDLPGVRTEVRLTRNELDDEIRAPLAEFIEELQQAVERLGIKQADLVAVASVGGGANIPVITTALSERLRLPVITTQRPELAAAAGAALRAARGPADDGATAVADPPEPVVGPMTAPMPAPTADEGEPSGEFRPLAWSEVDDEGDDLLAESVEPYDYDPPAGVGASRPPVPFEPGPAPAFHEAGDYPPIGGGVPWYRRPLAMVGALVALLLLAAAGTFVLLRQVLPTSSTPTTTTTTVTSAPPVTTQPPPQTEPPVTRTVTVAPPPPVSHAPTTTTPTTSSPPESPPSSSPPSSPSNSSSSSPQPPSPSTAQPGQPCWPPIPGLPTLPGLPPCPTP